MRVILPGNCPGDPSDSGTMIGRLTATGFEPGTGFGAHFEPHDRSADGHDLAWIYFGTRCGTVYTSSRRAAHQPTS